MRIPELLLLSDVRPALSSQQLTALGKVGLILARQFEDAYANDHGALRKLIGIDPGSVMRRIRAMLPERPASAAIMSGQLPLIGGALAPDTHERRPPVPATYAPRTPVGGPVEEVLARLGAVPEHISLEPHLPEVFSQHHSGTCCGQTVAGLRTFLHPRKVFSGEFIYRGAKIYDPFGPSVEGTLLRSALEFTYRHGAVPAQDYTYSDFTADPPKDIIPLYPDAAKARIKGYADLLEGLTRFDALPKLILAALLGRLVPGIGPRPVMMSTPIFPSMLAPFARDTGIMHLPLPHEKTPCGGHAWLITGAVAKSHPAVPGDVAYFSVRNSWSAGYAAKNPLGLRGHALIPQAFFANPDWVYECWLGLAEPSPAAATAAVPPSAVA